jgi:hypothetical protein
LDPVVGIENNDKPEFGLNKIHYLLDFIKSRDKFRRNVTLVERIETNWRIMN